MSRLFVGIALPAAVTRQLQHLQTGLAGARWRPVENFHITLRFIGDVPPPLERDIDIALADLQAPAFQIRLGGIGYFGKSRPKAVWSAVDDQGALKHLAAKVETALQRIGLVPETRKFLPHVTLAYLRGARLGQVKDYVAAHSGFHSPPFDVERFVLYQSHLGKGASHYVKRCEYDLQTFAGHAKEAW